MLKAILFDLDGTLIDSERFYFDCWNEILAEAGAQLTFQDWTTQYMGATLQQNAQKLKNKYGIGTPLDELVERRRLLTIERFRTTDVPLMPFVPEILEFYFSKGIRMTIATSSQREDVEAIFTRNGLRHYFECIITRSDVTHGKPHPESYLTCVQKLGINKPECIVIEDTPTGIAAAKAAGLVCYAVQSNIAEHSKLTEADRIFSNLVEVQAYISANFCI